MRFGFLAHAVSPEHRNQVRMMHTLGGAVPGAGPAVHVVLPAVRTVASASGARCTGEVRQLAYEAAEILRHPNLARRLVVEEVRQLAEAGAGVVGLGGATSMVGDHGLRTAEDVGVPLTSGNSLTAYSAWQALRSVADQVGTRPEDTVVGVLGFPGAVATAVARLLLDDGFRLELVHRRAGSAEDRLLAELPSDAVDRVRLGSDLAGCLDRTTLLVAASSTGGLIDPAVLRPGTVVLDVALPRDVLGPTRREDVLVLDGGLVSAGPELTIDAGGPLAPSRSLNGCLAETIVLALEERAESWSLGRRLDVDRVRAIGQLAARHGLRPDPPTSSGRVLPVDAVERLRVHHGRPGRPAGVAAATAERFARRVNPPLARLLDHAGLDQVFTAAHGCTLVTDDGVEYLDMVAGYGCLNLGHNHPVVVERLRRFLDAGEPTFVQYVSKPVHAARLAERLCELAPGGMERVFLSNSGAEAVEAALKLARAATGRTRLVHVDNGYHGKTVGALSVTGRATHRGPFGSLLDGCVAVPFGDLEALAAALPEAAAFIVEPILGEGGVVLPPTGYLAKAQQLCRDAGAVFVVDEVQTGLGRTGALFAAATENLAPDVLCLAKSLSGGLVPIGATLATAEVWDAAYGTPHRALLQSSTFGGGGLAAAAGLATLDVLAAEGLCERAVDVGDHLRRGLGQVAAHHSLLADVRGRGLMTGITLDAELTGGGRALAEDVLARMPGDLRALADWLPGDALAALRSAGAAAERGAADLVGLALVRALARDHRIVTFLSANSNRVLRVQPPLLLSRSEADRFVDALDAACAGLAVHGGLESWAATARSATAERNRL